MHNHAIAVPDRREASQVSPAIGAQWLEDDERPRPLILQMRLPVSAEEMATALYDFLGLSPADLADDINVWGFAATVIVQDGLKAIERRAAEVQGAEARGTLANPAWLGLCRRRVAEVSGTVWGLLLPLALTELAASRRAGC